jgi:hypothetical protein
MMYIAFFAAPLIKKAQQVRNLGAHDPLEVKQQGRRKAVADAPESLAVRRLDAKAKDCGTIDTINRGLRKRANRSGIATTLV